jgi:hypothetical protein
MDLDTHRAQTLSRLARGVILLPDGSGLSSGTGFGSHHLQSSSSDDSEMFDNADEDKDLESQVNKGTPSTEESSDDRTRREETPAPATLPSRSHNDGESKVAAEPKQEVKTEVKKEEEPSKSG